MEILDLAQQVAYLGAELAGALGQAAHLVGHHGETAPRITGTPPRWLRSMPAGRSAVMVLTSLSIWAAASTWLRTCWKVSAIRSV